jgi:citronellol/citronellal dehydrogenase
LLSEASAFINGTVIRVDGGVPNARHSWPLEAAGRTLEFNGFSRYQPPAELQELAGITDSNDQAAPSSAGE